MLLESLLNKTAKFNFGAKKIIIMEQKVQLQAYIIQRFQDTIKIIKMDLDSKDLCFQI
jgi:hypothetical protein